MRAPELLYPGHCRFCGDLRDFVLVPRQRANTSRKVYTCTACRGASLD